MDQESFNQFLNTNFKDPKYVATIQSVAAEDGIDKVFNSLNHVMLKGKQVKSEGGLLGGGLSNVLEGKQEFDSNGEDIISKIHRKHNNLEKIDIPQYISPELYYRDDGIQRGQDAIGAFKRSLIKTLPYTSLASTPEGFQKLNKSIHDYIGLGYDITDEIPDPNFNKDEYLKVNNVSAEDYEFYDTIVSKASADKMTDWINTRNKEMREDADFWGWMFAGNIAGVALDPVTYVFPTLKAESLMARVSYAALASGGIAAGQEFLLQETDPTRSYQDSLINIALSSIIAGSVAGVISKGVPDPNVTQTKINQTLEDIDVEKTYRQIRSALEGDYKPEDIPDLSLAAGTHLDEYSNPDSTNRIQDAVQWLNSKLNVTGDLDNSPIPASRETSNFNTLHVVGAKGDGITGREDSIRVIYDRELIQGETVVDTVIDILKPIRKLGVAEDVANDWVFRVAANPKNADKLPKEYVGEIKAAAAELRKYWDDQEKIGIEEGFFDPINTRKVKTGESYVSININQDLRYNEAARTKLREMIVRYDNFNRAALQNQRILEDTKKAIFDLDDVAFRSSKITATDNIRLTDKEFWADALKKINLSKYGEGIKKAIDNFDLKAIKGFLKDDFSKVADDVLDSVRSYIKKEADRSVEDKIDDIFKNRSGDIEFEDSARLGEVSSIQRRNKLYTYDDLSAITSKGLSGAIMRSASDFGIAAGFQRNYKTADPAKAFKERIAATRADAEKLKKQLDKSDPMYEKKALELDDRVEKDIDLIKTQMQMITGTYSRDGNYKTPLYIILRMLKAIQTMISMGASSISIVPELATATYKNLASHKITELKAINMIIDGIKMSSPKDIGMLGVSATEASQNNILRTWLQNLDPRGGTASKAEVLARKGAAGMFSIIKFGWLDDFTRRVCINTGFNDYLPRMDRYLTGTATADDLTELRKAGLNKKKIEAIFRNIEKHSTKDADGGLHLNEALWDKEARDATGFLFREVSKVSARGIAEHQPRWLSTQVGAFLFAFQSYAFSNQQQRVLYNAYNLNKNRGEVMANVMMSIFGAGVTSLLRSAVKNEEPNWERLPLDMVMYSGVLGIGGDLSMLGYNVLGTNNNDAIFRQTMPIAQRFGQVQAARRVLFEGSRSESDIKKTFGLTGLNTLIYTAGITNHLAKEMSDSKK